MITNENLTTAGITNGKILSTRVALKYDTYANWIASDPILLAGEVAFATIPNLEGSTSLDNGSVVLPQIVVKVGDGASKFSELPFVSAKAQDVYAWAKGEEKPVYSADEIEGLADFINTEIQDTNDNTTYSFEIVDNNLVVKATPHVLGEAGEETVVATLALVSDAEFVEYKTANDAEVAKKLNASEEIGFVYSDGTTTPVVRTDVITENEVIEVGQEPTYLGSPYRVANYDNDIYWAY